MRSLPDDARLESRLDAQMAELAKWPRPPASSPDIEDFDGAASWTRSTLPDRVQSFRKSSVAFHAFI